LTLSPEREDSLLREFRATGAEVQSLNLSRFAGALKARRLVSDLVEQIQPQLIHTHGIRADVMLESLGVPLPWILTSRNFPPEDYPTKFGLLKGSLMVRRHLMAMRKCNYVVACSSSISKKLSKEGVAATTIHNGVHANLTSTAIMPMVKCLQRPIFVAVGNLIPRKNVDVLLKSFLKLNGNGFGSLIIIGDGPCRVDLENAANENVVFTGNVNNVSDYLATADYFVSTSCSEGLPNSVLEALAAGLPVILSDIEAHREIAEHIPQACSLFSLLDGPSGLSKTMTEAPVKFKKLSQVDFSKQVMDVFSDEKMSFQYSILYRNILSNYEQL
jgi:glycosyltransferase involved in cell wall biosynthesis